MSVGLPVVGRLARQRVGDRCAIDGVAIEPIYRVRIVDRGNRSHEFCCLKCALLWQSAHEAESSAVFVTDETGGKEVLSRQAYFAVSTVVTMPTTLNRIHAFAEETDAQKHAQTFGGRVLNGADRPFHELE
jgi:hypothetical protein